MAESVIKKDLYKWGNGSAIPASGDRVALETYYQSASNYKIFQGQTSQSVGNGFYGMKFADNVSPQAICICFYRAGSTSMDAYICFAKRVNGTWSFSPSYSF